MNAGYASMNSEIRSFFVGSSQGSSSIAVVLNTPLNNLYINENLNQSFPCVLKSIAHDDYNQIHQL